MHNFPCMRMIYQLVSQVQPLLPARIKNGITTLTKVVQGGVSFYINFERHAVTKDDNKIR